MKKSLFFAAVLIAFGLVLVSNGFGQRPPIILGGYKVVSTDGEGVVAAADFAIKAQSEKDEMEYELGGIAKAEQQVVAGTNYRLCMDVSANGEDGMYVQVVVNQDLKANYKILSWAASTCGDAEGSRKPGTKKPAADGYKKIEKTDAGAGLAADFAVKTRSAKTKTTIKLGGIVAAEDKEMDLGTKRNFRLCLKVSEGGTSSFAKAIIAMDAYSNLKLLSWTPSTCGAPAAAKPSDGEAFMQVDKSDAGLEMAADFAVEKHSKDTKVDHTLSAILKGEEKGMFSVTRRICMKVAEDGKTKVVQAVVSMDQYSNMKLLSWEHSTCGN